MAVFYTAGYAAAAAQPMTHARLLGEPWAATVTADTAQDGFAAERAGIPDTATWWLSATGGATRTLTLAFGAARSVDAIGLAGHNLAGATVTLEGATDVGLTTWVELDDRVPTTDASALFLFAAQTLYAVRIVVAPLVLGDATKISVAMAGLALEMPVMGYNDLGPIDLGLMVSMTTYRSENGQLAGRYVQYTGLSGRLVFEYLPESWVRSTFLPFIRYTITKPFFAACRPSAYPDDCSFAWTTNNTIPERMRMKNFMRVTMEVNAHVPNTLL